MLKYFRIRSHFTFFLNYIIGCSDLRIVVILWNLMNYSMWFISANKNVENEVLKLNVRSGSTKEYVFLHGPKPLVITNLKMELSRVFKIEPEHQFIVYRGKNLHEYVDDTPLEIFGIENNSPILVWSILTSNKQDVRLPRNMSPTPSVTDLIFSPRIPLPPINPNQRGSVLLF